MLGTWLLFQHDRSPAPGDCSPIRAFRTTQVAFGHGHPVTSGSPGIDYFVSSDVFETFASIDCREARRTVAATAINFLPNTVNTVLANAHGSSGVVVQHGMDGRNLADGVFSEVIPPAQHGGMPGEERGGDGSQDYSEQLVLFDSLSASLPEFVGPPNSPSAVAAAVRDLTGMRDEDHGYHCMQHSKKIHPDFDLVMRDVLLRDPAAKLVLTTGSKVGWRLVLNYPITKGGWVVVSHLWHQ